MIEPGSHDLSPDFQDEHDMADVLEQRKQEALLEHAREDAKRGVSDETLADIGHIDVPDLEAEKDVAHQDAADGVVIDGENIAKIAAVHLGIARDALAAARDRSVDVGPYRHTSRDGLAEERLTQTFDIRNRKPKS